ncbi:hypothetical protein C8R43DRAFT_957980 [Mycena crocata]|nr:hypothetical protein C8R43DRAFT_957980 [Mycena crocata]
MNAEFGDVRVEQKRLTVKQSVCDEGRLDPNPELGGFTIKPEMESFRVNSEYVLKGIDQGLRLEESPKLSVPVLAGLSAKSCFRGEMYMVRDNLKWRMVNSPFISLRSLLSTMTENAITKPGAFSRPRVEHGMFIDIPVRKKLNVPQCHSLAKSIELANVPDTDTATALSSGKNDSEWIFGNKIVLPWFGSEPLPNLNRTRTAPELRFGRLNRTAPNPRFGSGFEDF